MSFRPTARLSHNIFTCKRHHIITIPRSDSKLATKVDPPYQKTTINFHDDLPVGPSIHPTSCPYFMKYFFNPTKLETLAALETPN